MKFPINEKSGVDRTLEGSWATPGPTASQIALSPHPMFITIAKSVVSRIPISNAPFVLRATSAEVIASPTTNVSTRSVARCDAITTGVASLPRITMPPLCSPMMARNRPMPMPIARLRSIGIASRIALRRPVSTRIEITRPSITITPIACSQVSPSVATRVNVTNAFKPSPAAIANG